MTDSSYFPEGTKESWDQFLSSFNKEILPLFAAHGYSREVALVAFLLDQWYQDDDEDDDLWKAEEWRI